MNNPEELAISARQDKTHGGDKQCKINNTQNQKDE